MTKFKKFAAVGAMVLLVGATSLTAFAAVGYNTPAEAVAALTGQSVESVTAQRIETGKTYGTIAGEAGKLTEFKDEMLQTKKDILAKRVEAGTITQAQADAIIAAIEENQATCDGTGLGNGNGCGLGQGAGFGCGSGQGMGLGRGNSQGRGQGGRFAR